MVRSPGAPALAASSAPPPKSRAPQPPWARCSFFACIRLYIHRSFKRASMASFARAAAPPRREWSVEDAARFAAVKEFELLQLLSTDTKALTTARRLGLRLGHTQPQTQAQHPAVAAGDIAAAPKAGAADGSSAASRATPRRARRRAARCAQPVSWADAQAHTPSHAAAAVGDAAAPRARAARPAEECARDAVPRANARKRRSAARSARRHAARSRPVRQAAHALIYFLRLRRLASMRRELAVADAEMSDGEYATPASSGSSSSPSKRGREHDSCEEAPASARRWDDGWGGLRPGFLLR